ncbi:MAG: hypothetical protein PUK59_05380 [Actinomycetaceae bacterium]|nr:hypothetical protein [Actinomycetaceae bacterium]MDY5854219.1 hypothetical protein [Arcanobacterium sp.]
MPSAAARTATHVIQKWPYYWPIVAFVVLLLSWGMHVAAMGSAVLAVILAGAVMAAVEHAEVVAHKVGEPFGSLILALAVTVIEVGMIVMLMFSGASGATTLARDTVFAATMLTTNMIIGMALVVATGTTSGALAYFNKEGAGTAFSAVLVIATGTMVLPSATITAPEGRFSTSQLIFVAVIALLVWIFFVLTQTRGHRDFFLPISKKGEIIRPNEHAAKPSTRRTLVSLALLAVSLVAVVGLSKVLSYPIEDAVTGLGLPEAVVGLVIAMVVLMPETIAAYKNARKGRTQIAMNLGYGSALASIGLTIPVVGAISIFLDMPIVLGLEPVHLVLFGLTGVLSILTIVQGRAVRLQGAMHLVVAAAYIFLVAVP